MVAAVEAGRACADLSPPYFSRSRASVAPAWRLCKNNSRPQQERRKAAETYLAKTSGGVDVLLDAVENGTIVFEQATVGVATAALQRARLGGGGR